MGYQTVITEGEKNGYCFGKPIKLTLNFRREHFKKKEGDKGDDLKKFWDFEQNWYIRSVEVKKSGDIAGKEKEKDEMSQKFLN